MTLIKIEHRNSNKGLARQRRGGEFLLSREVCLPRVLKNKNPKLPFYLIMTSLTFVFNLSEIIILTEDHI